MLRSNQWSRYDWSHFLYTSSNRSSCYGMCTKLAAQIFGLYMSVNISSIKKIRTYARFTNVHLPVYFQQMALLWTISFANLSKNFLFFFFLQIINYNYMCNYIVYFRFGINYRNNIAWKIGSVHAILRALLHSS